MATTVKKKRNLCDKLLETIGEVDRPRAVCTGGDRTLTMPGLQVDGLGRAIQRREQHSEAVAGNRRIRFEPARVPVRYVVEMVARVNRVDVLRAVVGGEIVEARDRRDDAAEQRRHCQQRSVLFGGRPSESLHRGLQQVCSPRPTRGGRTRIATSCVPSLGPRFQASWIGKTAPTPKRFHQESNSVFRYW